MFIGAFALSLLGFGSLYWFERMLDRHGLRQREVLARGVLGELAAHDVVERDDRDRDVRLAKQLKGCEPPLTSDQRAVRRNNNGVH
jgi:hypothetical protein